MVCIHTVAVENFPIPLTVYYQAMQKQEKGFVVLLENTTCYFPDKRTEAKLFVYLSWLKRKFLLLMT